MKELYSTPEYFADLLARIAGLGAGDRVMLATMAFTPEKPIIGQIVAALCSAAQRGAAVTLLVDAYTFLLNDDGNQVGPLFFNAELGKVLPRHYQAAREALEDIERSGGKYTVTNRPRRAFTNPFAGRSHIKFGIINDRVYIGGCNLNAGTFIDMMTGWEDRRAAAWLAGLAQRMADTGNALVATDSEDAEYVVDNTSTLLLDAGVSGRSIIFDRALEMIDAAKERVLISCQFFPNDVTAKHLLKAHQRGVQVEIIYNHPSKHPAPNNFLHHGVVQAARLTLPKSFFVHSLPTELNFLHAKLIATERSAMVGSHNYVTAGIRLGTAEIALESHDREFAERAVAVLRAQLSLPV